MFSLLFFIKMFMLEFDDILSPSQTLPRSSLLPYLPNFSLSLKKQQQITNDKNNEETKNTKAQQTKYFKKESILCFSILQDMRSALEDRLFLSQQADSYVIEAGTLYPFPLLGQDVWFEPVQVLCMGITFSGSSYLYHFCCVCVMPTPSCVAYVALR